MREIKFRAWDGEDMLTNLDSVPLEALRVGAIETPDGSSVISCVYMQYIGLDTNDGIEVFEGDKVKCFIDGDLHYWVVGMGVDRDLNGWNVTPQNIEDGLEILGNIYEHGELK